MSQFMPSAVALLVAYLSAPIFRKIAVTSGVLDLPGGRKIHKSATPLLGGLAIYCGIMAGLLFNPNLLYFLLPVLTGATIILIVGLINDIRALSARFRLVCQCLASSAIIFSGMRIDFLPRGLWGDIGEIIITLIWLVGLTNAYNYLDGLDGLAAGSAVVNLFCFAIILFGTGQVNLGIFSVILIAACLGFLPYNFSQKKMFLGDAGSTLLGFLLASIAVAGYWAEDSIVKISIPVLILGVPIFDMIFTTVIRIKEEKVKTVVEWLVYGGKDHFHHYLVYLGLRPLSAVIFIYFVTLSLGISAIMVSNDTAADAFLTLAQASIIFGVIAVLIVAGKRHHSGWSED